MAPNQGRRTPNAANVHFGNQVRKDRLTRGWSLRQFVAESGIDLSSASMLENGKLTPNRRIAEACDRVFPKREGWYIEYFQDSQSWIPPGLRSWAEHENVATRLEVWAPGTVHGLFQVRDYAETWIRTWPGVTEEQVAARLATRTARRDSALTRAGYPPLVACIVDHAALYRLVGSPAIMVAQMTFLLEVAAMPSVTVQVLPAIAHPAAASELIIADNRAAYVEHMGAGAVYTEVERVHVFEQVFATLRGEAYRTSESAAIIKEAQRTWIKETGGKAATAPPTALASK
jgi:transcriptional regulator with XRE-family HTH domain